MKNNWQTKKLDDLAEINGGGTPPTNNPNNFNGDVPWFTPSEITSGTVSVLENSRRQISEEAKKYTKITNKNNILLSTRATIGNVAITSTASGYNQGIKGIEPVKELDSWFLAYWLLANAKRLERASYGTTFKELSTTALKRIEVSFPALNIQRQIVERLDAIRKLQELNQQEIEKVEGLFNSALYSSFKNRKSWKKKLLGEVSENLDRLRVPISGVERAKRKGNIPYYGANGQTGWIDDYLFDETLLLVAEDGGNWGPFEQSSYIISGKSWVNNHAHVLRIKNRVLLWYLSYYLNFDDLRKYITGTTRGKLNQNALNSIVIWKAPSEKMEQIVEHLDSIKKYQKSLLGEKEKLSELFESMLNKAMEGELVN